MLLHTQTDPLTARGRTAHYTRPKKYIGTCCVSGTVREKFVMSCAVLMHAVHPGSKPIKPIFFFFQIVTFSCCSRQSPKHQKSRTKINARKKKVNKWSEQMVNRVQRMLTMGADWYAWLIIHECERSGNSVIITDANARAYLLAGKQARCATDLPSPKLLSAGFWPNI